MANRTTPYGAFNYLVNQHAHSHGEWFQPAPELLAYITANAVADGSWLDTTIREGLERTTVDVPPSPT